MLKRTSRRTFLAIMPAALAFAPRIAMAQEQQYKPHPPIPDGIPDFPEKTPRLDPKLVKAFVIAAHSSLNNVQALFEAEPHLLNACWDWGDGDFETALEGAGHMGRADIAEYLISKGARLNLFCAAMLGDLEFVKSTLAAHPGSKDSKGPHGISLMSHAVAGKEKAAAVVEYLKSIGLSE